MEPEYCDDELSVVGINTVRIWRMKEGGVGQLQTKRVYDMFHGLGPEILRVVVSHHPFNIPKQHYKRPVARAKKFWKSLEDSHVDLFLLGHLHDTLIHHEDPPYKIATNGALVIQAGTAISISRRKEGNAFNLISFDFPVLRVELHAAEAGARSFFSRENGNPHSFWESLGPGPKALARN